MFYCLLPCSFVSQHESRHLKYLGFSRTGVCMFISEYGCTSSKGFQNAAIHFFSIHYEIRENTSLSVMSFQIFAVTECFVVINISCRLCLSTSLTCVCCTLSKPMRIKQSTVLRLSFTIPFAVEVWRLRQSTQIRQMTCCMF